MAGVHRDGAAGCGEVKAVDEGAEPDDDRGIVRSVIFEEESSWLAEPMHLEDRVARCIRNCRAAPFEKLTQHSI